MLVNAHRLNQENQKLENTIQQVIKMLDEGKIRVAENINGEWKLNMWIKKAILIHFKLQNMRTIDNAPGNAKWWDKIKPKFQGWNKEQFQKAQIRTVPQSFVREGTYIAPKTVLMPCFVNIGAYVDSGTMVDTWATVGSCAQIGKNVHLSGGAGIGGVLEPVQAAPVIIEDNCFIGSRSIIVEGVHIESEAVIGAGVTLTMSTKIIDVSGPEPITYRGRVPARSVVIPGSINKEFPAGTYGVNCALIIGTRKESTDKKTSLNDVLRDFQVAV